MLPRVHGLRPAAGAARDRGVAETAWPERLPPAPAGQKLWVEQEPVPMTARRGQVLILCSSCLHSAWHNKDMVPRKAMGSSWAAATVATSCKGCESSSPACAHACRRIVDTSSQRWWMRTCTSKQTIARCGPRLSTGRRATQQVSYNNYCPEPVSSVRKCGILL